MVIRMFLFCIINHRYCQISKKGKKIMQKWRLIFDVSWEEGEPPKRQIFEAREELQFVLQLAQTLDACKTVKLIRMERED